MDDGSTPMRRPLSEAPESAGDTPDEMEAPGTPSTITALGHTSQRQTRWNLYTHRSEAVCDCSVGVMKKLWCQVGTWSAKRAEGVDRVETPCGRGLQHPADFLEIQGV